MAQGKLPSPTYFKKKYFIPYIVCGEKIIQK